MDIRQPYFSRQGWYPDNEKSCREAVESYLSTFSGQPLGTHAGVVPHAGWVYSGQVAAHAFAALRATDEILSNLVFELQRMNVSSASISQAAAAFFNSPSRNFTPSITLGINL